MLKRCHERETQIDEKPVWLVLSVVSLIPGHIAVSLDATVRQFLCQSKDGMRKKRREEDDCRSEVGCIVLSEAPFVQ